MRVFSFLFLLAIATTSCDKQTDPIDNDASQSGCDPVIISSDLFIDLAPNQVSVQEVSIDGDCLTVKMGIGGCDENHEVDMISSGDVAESLPPQITFDFKDNDLQVCNAYFYIEREFDLDPIRDHVDEDVLVRFRNSEVSILYKK